MDMRPEQLRERTKAFALRVIRLFRSLPYRGDTQVLGKQLLRCGTSVAQIIVPFVERDQKQNLLPASESWLKEQTNQFSGWSLLTESGIVSREKTEALLIEARELTAIFTASQQTAKKAA